jgi:drug/metabolite transporter (DMT)-like permease
VALVVLMQWGDYRGLGGSESRPLSRTSALPVLPTFVGSLLALPGMFVTHRTADGTALRRLFDRRMLLIAVTFIAGEVCNQASIILAGSLTFTVVYSSVTIWTAAIGIPLLHKTPNATQMLALVLIVAGLACSVLLHGDGTAGTDSNNGDIPDGGSGGSASTESPPDQDSAGFVLGAVAGVCGALSYGLCYVLTELVQKADDAPPPEALCVFLGMVGTPVIGIWVVAWAGANDSQFSLLLGIRKAIITLLPRQALDQAEGNSKPKKGSFSCALRA